MGGSINTLALSRFVLLLPVLLVVFLGCSRIFPPLGQFYQGEVLGISAYDVKRAQEIRFVQGGTHYALVSIGEKQELIAFQLVVVNARANSIKLEISKAPIELVGLNQLGTYTQINPFDVSHKVSAPDDPSRFLYVDHLLWGTFELSKGEELEGWAVFKIPKGILFEEMRWWAGDFVILKK